MRRAAARAASRRGSSMTMRFVSASPASRMAGGTRVVLPAPVGAWITTRAWCLMAARTCGKTESIGRDTWAMIAGIFDEWRMDLITTLLEHFFQSRCHTFFCAGGHPAPITQVAVALLNGLLSGNVARSAFAVAHHHDERI